MVGVGDRLGMHPEGFAQLGRVEHLAGWVDAGKVSRHSVHAGGAQLDDRGVRVLTFDDWQNVRGTTLVACSTGRGMRDRGRDTG